MIAQAATMFSEYGPWGAALGILATALAWLYKDKVAREREIDTRHMEERKAWNTECRAERTEIMAVHTKAWEESRVDLKEALSNNARAVSALEVAVRDLHVDVKARRLKEEQG